MRTGAGWGGVADDAGWAPGGEAEGRAADDAGGAERGAVDDAGVPGVRRCRVLGSRAGVGLGVGGEGGTAGPVALVCRAGPVRSAGSACCAGAAVPARQGVTASRGVFAGGCFERPVRRSVPTGWGGVRGSGVVGLINPVHLVNLVGTVNPAGPVTAVGPDVVHLVNSVHLINPVDPSTVNVVNPINPAGLPEPVGPLRLGGPSGPGAQRRVHVSVSFGSEVSWSHVARSA